MTTETRIIVRPAQDALRAVGPIKTHADAPTPSDMEEKPPTPASKKHSGDPEVAKAASASKKPANDTEEVMETLASTKHTKETGGAKALSASKKPKVATTKAKAKPKPKAKAKVPATPKSTRKTKKVAASSKPASKKPPVKKPAAKQLPTKKGSAKEAPKTPKLPPKRTDVRLPGPYEEVSSDSSDTDTPNPRSSPTPASTRGYHLSCSSPRIGSTWPIVLIKRPLRRWAPSGIARPTPLVPKTSYSLCDTGLETSTESTFDKVACLAQALRSATSVRSCSWWTPVSPASGTRLSSKGGWTTWAIPGPSS
ncbi:hypothetical protein PF003_g6830 [Phytophthora fragariae]|nr:hypothetical protein PF003_g6830 [Phytophthora fragariae]